MYTYSFTFSMDFTANDPSTPMGGTCRVEMVFEADSLAEAKAQLGSALDAATSNADVVNVTGIYEAPQ